MPNFYREKGKAKIVHHKMDTVETFDVLKPGYYDLNIEKHMFSNLTTYTPVEYKDTLVNFETGPISEAIEKISNFLKPEVVKSYEDLKIGHKLGIILHGPPGTGKTCTVTLLINKLVKDRKTIGLDCTGLDVNIITKVITEIRENQDNPIIIFVDEVDVPFTHSESSWLPFLDGAVSFNNVIFIGCTNYLDDVPNRIKNRKSRIKHLIEIKSFPIEVYKEYVKGKLGDKIDNEKLEEFAYKAEEACLTIDDLKHAVIDYYIEGVSITKAVNKAKELQEVEE